MDIKEKLNDISKDSHRYIGHNRKIYTHKDVFDCIHEAVSIGMDLNSKELYDGNLVSLLLDIYYNEFGAYNFVEESCWEVEINNKSEALVPLAERESKILDELFYLKENGYDFNNSTTLIDETLEDNDESPLMRVLSMPNDPLMAEWLIDNGCKEQLILPLTSCEENTEIVVDWCFDEIDLNMEEIIETEDRTKKDLKFLYKLAADTIRAMIKNGLTYRSGNFIDIDDSDMVSYHHIRMKY